MRRKDMGFSLTEVLLTVVLLSIVAMGVASVMMSLSKMQARSSTLASITQLTSRLENIARDSDSWRQTVQNVINVNMACLRNQTACASPNTDLPFALYDSTGALAFDGIAANTGFTLMGVACNTFNPVAPGNPACPIRYNLTWRAVCTGAGSTCVNPQIRIDGRFVMNGANLDEGALNTTRYSFSVIRGVGNTYEQVIVRYAANGNVGEGDCNPAAGWNNRRRLVGPPVTDIEGRVLSIAGDIVRLDAGTYECHASAPAYRIGANRIRIRNMTSGAVVGLGQSAYSHVTTGTQVYASAHARIDISVPSNFVVEHRCTASSATSFGFGMPVPDETYSYANPAQPTVYTVLRCVKTS